MKGDIIIQKLVAITRWHLQALTDSYVELYTAELSAELGRATAYMNLANSNHLDITLQLQYDHKHALVT